MGLNTMYMPWISSSLEVLHYPDLLMEMSCPGLRPTRLLRIPLLWKLRVVLLHPQAPKRKTFFAPKWAEFDQVCILFIWMANGGR